MAKRLLKKVERVFLAEDFYITGRRKEGEKHFALFYHSIKKEHIDGGTDGIGADGGDGEMAETKAALLDKKQKK